MAAVPCPRGESRGGGYVILLCSRCLAGVQSTSSGEMDKERASKAMADPEIQAILRDPMVQQALNDMSTDPRAAQKVCVCVCCVYAMCAVRNSTRAHVVDVDGRRVRGVSTLMACGRVGRVAGDVGPVHVAEDHEAGSGRHRADALDRENSLSYSHRARCPLPLLSHRVTRPRRRCHTRCLSTPRRCRRQHPGAAASSARTCRARCAPARTSRSSRGS
jgi:hypothetical protein